MNLLNYNRIQNMVSRFHESAGNVEDKITWSYGEKKTNDIRTVGRIGKNR